MGCLCDPHRFSPEDTQKISEAPPLKELEAAPHQIPIIFVPSLHLGSGCFSFLFWRLKKNFWNNLWPFQWKSFLEKTELLEDQLFEYIQEVISRTQTQRFRVISFGTSRPLVARVLNNPKLKAYCDHWVAISSPEKLSPTLKFFGTRRMYDAYEKFEESKKPDLVIVGEGDLICYPREVFGEGQRLQVPQVGHFGTLLHAHTTQAIMKELES